MHGFALNEKLEFFVKRPNVSRVVVFFFPESVSSECIPVFSV